MKYLYVLTSNDSDYFFEQAILSITSLRLQMPNAFVSLLIDDITETGLNGSRNEICKAVNELVSVKIDERFNKKARSRWLKTSMRRHISGDFIYIDIDTIIAEDLSALDSTDMNLGAVLNEHTCLADLKKNNPVYYKEMQALDKKLGFSSTSNSNTYFNSGFMLCRDCPIVYDFFTEWHRLWFLCFEKGVVTDQQSFNQTNYTLGNVITELEGVWNNQILADGGIRYLHTAKIIHYFAAMKGENPYLLASHSILEHIKETGTVEQKIKLLLLNPKNHFLQNSRLRAMDKKSIKFNKSVICAIAKFFANTKIGSSIDFLFIQIYKNIIKPLRKK
jgi:hypothetical protein